MFRIQNAHDLSKRDRAARRAADEKFAARLARELARLGRASVAEAQRIDSILRLPRIARYVVEPVSKRHRLWRRATSRAVAFAALDIPEHVMQLEKLSERKYLRALWRVSAAWPVQPERLDLWRRNPEPLPRWR